MSKEEIFEFVVRLRLLAAHAKRDGELNLQDTLEQAAEIILEKNASVEALDDMMRKADQDIITLAMPLRVLRTAASIRQLSEDEQNELVAMADKALGAADANQF